LNRVAGGYKAAIHNPNVSEEAKENAQQRLDEMGVSPESDEKPVDKSSDANPNRVAGGHKATLTSKYSLFNDE
jgi:hypothetical protein